MESEWCGCYVIVYAMYDIISLFILGYGKSLSCYFLVGKGNHLFLKTSPLICKHRAKIFFQRVSLFQFSVSGWTVYLWEIEASAI